MAHCIRLRDTVIPFGQYKGLTLLAVSEIDFVDEETGFRTTGLGYLDWLWGQSYLYGAFQERLGRFLSHPSIANQLNDLFPDEWDDSRQPAFTVEGTYCKGGTHPSRHQKLGALAQAPVEDYIPPKPRAVWDWSTLIDFIVFIDEKLATESYDPADLFEIDMDKVREAAKRLEKQNHDIVKYARAQYKAYRQALRRARRQTISAPSEYRSRMAKRATRRIECSFQSSPPSSSSGAFGRPIARKRSRKKWGREIARHCHC